MSNIKSRAFKAVNLKEFNSINIPEKVKQINVKPRKDYVLRMLIKTPYTQYKIPEELGG